MAFLQTILTGPVAAALVTAIALGLQAWLQRRATTRQRRDDQAHEVTMAQERHRADLERLDREASHRRREVNQDRLQTAHRDLLGQLDQATAHALKHIMNIKLRSEPEPLDLSMFGVSLGSLLSPTADSEKEVRLLGSERAFTAGSHALSAAMYLQQASLMSEMTADMTLERFERLVQDVADARNAYREALRIDIGAA